MDRDCIRQIRGKVGGEDCVMAVRTCYWKGQCKCGDAACCLGSRGASR